MSLIVSQHRVLSVWGRKIHLRSSINGRPASFVVCGKNASSMIVIDVTTPDTAIEKLDCCQECHTGKRRKRP